MSDRVCGDCHHFQRWKGFDTGDCGNGNTERGRRFKDHRLHDRSAACPHFETYSEWLRRQKAAGRKTMAHVDTCPECQGYGEIECGVTCFRCHGLGQAVLTPEEEEERYYGEEED